MAYTRTPEFYDLIGQGLNNMGYTSFSEYINDMFAEKYNAEQTFAQMGFPLNPALPIQPTYEQLDATIRPYTMATYVNEDSDGPTKSTDGLSLKMGGLPIFKHEYTIGRKTLREQMILADRIGSVTPEIADVAVQQLFITTDDLLGGNYNTFRYQRHQIVSNEGKLVIDAHNNPLGVSIQIDFNVPAKNKISAIAYTVDSDGKVTEKANANLLKTLKDVRHNARKKDNCPAGHYEVAYNTWQEVVSLPSLRQLYMTDKQPLVAEKDRATLAELVTEDAFKAWFEKQIGAKIEVVDFIGQVERFDPKQKKMVYDDCPGFKEGVFVYVPDGAIGDAQFGKPIVMQTPGARVSLFDGGRTLLRQVFNDENMMQTIKSEVSGLIVPNKTRWMYYVTVK